MKVYKTYTERNLKHHNVDGLFDEDYKKIVTLFGLFKIEDTFKLRNSGMDDASS